MSNDIKSHESRSTRNGKFPAIEQAKHFTEATDVNALALTKLDGTAKGGVAIGISNQFKIPIKYIGVGEGIDQLQPFDKKTFVNALFEM